MIAVIGDIMLDTWIRGDWEKIGEEASPVIGVRTVDHHLGAAANVALNLKELGEDVFLFGAIGRDESGVILEKLLKEKGIKYHLKKISKTTHKMRINDLLRCDDETKEKVYFTLDEIMECHPDTIIISDYGKGVITQVLCDDLKHTEIPLLVDPKFCVYPRNTFLIKPNIKEAMVLTDTSNIRDALTLLKIRYERILLTEGKDGMTLYDGDEKTHFPTEAKDVYDVTGAGDCAMAIIAHLMKKCDLKKAIELANKGAGIVVGHQGQYQVKLSELDGEKIVWTNGCFDILHAGHVDYLEKAGKLGYLIVGITSDETLKKEKREPIMPQEERARIIKGIKGVKEVVVYHKAADFIKEIKPDIYVKGGDYTLETINQEERKIVEEYGGRVMLIPLVYPTSTTKILEKL